MTTSRRVTYSIERALAVLLSAALVTFVSPAVALAQLPEALTIDGRSTDSQPLLVGNDGSRSAPNFRMGADEERDAPDTMVGYRSPENLGTSFDFRVTGAATGIIWGSEIYTDDSKLAVAAVHAGLVQPGETKVVRVTILPGRNSYRGSQERGVSSNSYGPWYGSYVLDSVEKSAQAAAIRQAPNSLSGVVGEIGQSFLYRVIGAVDGSVWGADVYTDDSALAAAAVHAGAVEAGETAVIKVTILPGRGFYNGSQRHGVSTYDYGSYSRSYMIDREGSTDTSPRNFTF
ncbi:MAG: LCCL domain-containing protein [Pirellulales bacterium]